MTSYQDLKYLSQFEKFGTATKFRVHKKHLRGGWFLFWMLIPVPVASAMIGALGVKLFKKDYLKIRRID